MKKFFSLLTALVFSFVMFAPGFALAADNAALSTSQKLEKVEQMLYGNTQGGSLIQRMDMIENDVYGIATDDPVLGRVTRMYDYLVGIPSNGEASFATKLNMVEWRLKESMSGDPARSRIEEAETMLNGTPSTGAFAIRLENLLKLTAYADGIVPVQIVTLPKDSLLKITFTEEISSRNNKKSDEVRFKAADNLYVNDVLVLPKGANGIGTIKKIRKPSAFGRDARVDIEFMYVYGIDGTKIPIYVGELAEQEAKTIAGAAGASIAGCIALGPVGLIGGAFIKGKQVVIPAGTLSVVQTSADKEVQGAIYQGQ
ncbi:MAG: hypothetical protein MJ048_05820 [Acidaminococcaceae bacterium]|nr:hypothetical protein [Acidaminococcaceae bacterium]